MDLTPHVDALGRELVTLLETGDERSRALVERVVGALDSTIRLTLLEALSTAADEIGRELAPGSVELRLRGRDPQFVVSAPAPEPPEDASPSAAEAVLTADDSAATRINLRLPEALKSAVEEAAAKEGRSVNAWLVQAATAALRPRGRDHAPSHGGPGPQRYTGWVQ
jgi:hypothetical protein